MIESKGDLAAEFGGRDEDWVSLRCVETITGTVVQRPVDKEPA